ncbi:MAG: LysM peptidoglycan-binding domain-containing protein [Gemmatimonadota bacterium]
MKRIIPLLLGSLILVFSGGLTEAEAQVVSVTEGRNHTVASGETLSTLAQQYLGSAELWDRIYQANRDRIQDPARIFVGQVLFIPGVPGQAWAAQGDDPDAVPAAPRTPRSLLDSRPFEAQPYSVPPGTGRTIFFPEEEGPAGQASMVYQTSQRMLRTLPSQAVREAGWIQRPGELLGELGWVDGLIGESRLALSRTTLLPFELVRVLPAPGTPRFQVGDRFLTARATHEVRGLEALTTMERATGRAAVVGRVIQPTGVVTIRAVEANGYVAEVTGEFDRMQVDDRIFPLPGSPVEGDAATVPATQQLEARMLGLQLRAELPKQGDVIFLDRGRSHGLAIGDELEAIVEGDPRFEVRVVGKVQVVGVQDELASARILEALAPVFRPGLRLRLSGQMP